MTAAEQLAEAEDARRSQFVATLRAIADGVEAGTLPTADTTSIAWHADQDTAIRIARELGGEWRASDDTREGTAVVHGELVAGRFPFSPLLVASLFVAPDEPTGQRDTASRRVAAELRAAVERDRQALIAAQGEPITRATLEAAGLIEGESDAGCSCGARFASDELDDHLAVCPLPEGDQ